MAAVKTVVDWLVEALIYGGDGGLLGFGLGLLITSQWGRLMALQMAWVLLPALTLAGFLLGVLGGERGINWIGRMIQTQRAAENGRAGAIWIFEHIPLLLYPDSETQVI